MLRCGIILFLVSWTVIPVAMAQGIDFSQPIQTEPVQPSSENTYENSDLPGVRKDPHAETVQPKGCAETARSSRSVNQKQTPGDCYRSPFTINDLGRTNSRDSLHPN